MRWRAVVDIEQARRAVGDVLARWWVALSWPESPPFSGGVLDSWPNRLTEGLSICKTEWRAIQSAADAERKEQASG